MFRVLQRSARIILFYGVFCGVMDGRPASAAEKGKIQESIHKAQAYLLKQKLTGAFGSMASLAYIKSGGDRKQQVIQSVVNEVLGKCGGNYYRPTSHHTYEAAVDIMLLEAVDEKQYREQIGLASRYIIEMQLENGSWYYPDRMEPGCCDTSITQYAVLGLWAATRVGVEVPSEIFEKIAEWHIAKQRDDGGFAYHPFFEKSLGREEKVGLSTMTAAGTSNMLIIRRILFGDVAVDVETRPEAPKKRFGVLERFTEDRPLPKRNSTIRISSIDESLKKSVKWMLGHYGQKSARHEMFFTYDFYCVERVAALLDTEELGGHDWYDEGSDELLLRQLKDGSWSDDCGSIGSTSLALMFLTKTTQTIVKPKAKINLMGGGIQIGGRGLPDNLNSIQVKDGNISTRKLVGSVDNLLMELERSSEAKVEDIQAAVVDSVQLDKPDELIGQFERLRKLASDSRPEVRRTAFWALGRSGKVSAAPYLIRGLNEADVTIAREASLALCVLSRRPEGCGKAIDPTDESQMGLKPDATDAERDSALETWRAESIKRWTDWYQKHRDYDERDDKASLRKTNTK